ncbi:hypothetical protein LCGC14_2945590 [marine sediment metagenome]|uniref:Uncharacterized protein n=1 Tax=marine sediment metagenome TaxID=412755 RepID=A0A0F8XGJ0_9ZZZZ
MNDNEATEQLIREAEQRAAKITGMRAMLNFLETHPQIPMPWFGQNDAFANSGEDIAEIARAMTPVTKGVVGNWYVLKRNFGNDVQLHVNFGRDAVCERIVIGTEDIPEKVIEAYTKEIVEWVCPDTILATS